MPAWIIVIEWISRAILASLFVLSIWSVAIILDRRKALKEVEQLDSSEEAKKLILAKDWASLTKWSESKTGLRSGTLRSAIATGNSGSESIDRSVKSYLTDEKVKLEKGFTTLASLGSNGPFIGLFGTVLGIIQAFGALAAQQMGTNAIMAALSEALIATAFGLLVAIPAQISYNVYVRRLKTILIDCESLKDLYVSRLGG